MSTDTTPAPKAQPAASPPEGASRTKPASPTASARAGTAGPGPANLAKPVGKAGTALKTGRVIAWMSLVLSLVFSGGLISFSLGWLGWQGFVSQPPLFQVGLILICLTPGLAVLALGLALMHAQRMHAANAMMLEAAATLLAPARARADESAALGQVIRQQCEAILETATNAHAALSRLRRDTEASVGDLEGLSRRLSGSAETASRALATEIGRFEAVPAALASGAETAVQSAQQAHDTVQSALVALSDAAEASRIDLTSQLADISTLREGVALELERLFDLAKDAAERSEALSELVLRLDSEMESARGRVLGIENQATGAVDAATKAAAAMRDALTSSIQDANAATDLIRREASKAREEARTASDRLREAANEAAMAIQAAAKAAEDQTLATETRLQRSADALFEPAPARSVRGPVTAPPAYASPPVAQSLAPNGPPPEAEDKHTRTPLDLGPSIAPDPADEPLDLADPILPKSTQVNVFGRERGVPRQEIGSTGTETGDNRRGSALSWRDLLSNVEEARPEPLDAGAEVMKALARRGIDLNTLFEETALIDLAARRRVGPRGRRRVVQDMASEAFTVLNEAMAGDAALRAHVEAFTASEEDAAEAAIQQAAEGGSVPSPRLAAYLLADAGLI